jgi:cobalt/nickel transport system ATP-binding protein
VAPLIAARDVAFAYPDGTAGLRGVDVTVRDGERLAVLGANGTGKSTLQTVLGGLEPPDSGTVTYFGDERDPEAVRDRLGVVLQNPEDYLFNATVRADIEYGPAQLDVPQAVARRRVDRLAGRLDLEGLLGKPPFRLSAGEQERAALAAALAVDPDVLLLDEPTSNLDAPWRERVLALLDERAEEGLTLVTFTPDADLAGRVADRALVLARDGTVATRGPVGEVLTDTATLAAHGLGQPTAVRLFEGLVDDPPLSVGAARELLEERLDDRERP